MDSSQSSTQVNKAKIEQYKIFKQRKDRERIPIANQYNTISFISSGTYGNVFKATKKNGHPKIYAIKKFKPDKEGEAALSSGISQSACREISLCREMKHENIVFLEQVILDPSDRSIAMVFDYAEHDLLQILQHHLQTERKGIPDYTVKSFLWQILNGVSYMHNNWVLHRDLKPANILVTTDGVVKIADLGLARLFQAPIYPLYHGDKVVVTIWYRAPELLLGSRHYTKGIDIWAIGCIYAELLMLKPLFKGDEAKMDAKKTIPFQKDQLTKIIDVLGFPTTDRWQEIEYMPEYEKLKTLKHNTQNNLKHLYQHQTYFPKVESGFNLLSMMLEYDPHKRISAENALKHPYFLEQPRPSQNSFINPKTRKQTIHYPMRREDKKLAK